MKENKVLFKEPMFYTPVLGLFLLSLAITSIIILNSSLIWDLSFKGFNYAVIVFRVPLGILAICGTWAALVAANHRSKLMIYQIKSTNSQNVFTNYFKHLEEFQKYVDDDDFLKSQLVNVRDTHDALYGSFDQFSPRVKISVKEALHNQITKIYNIIYKIDQGGDFDAAKELNPWNNSTSWIERLINIAPALTRDDIVIIEYDDIPIPYPKDYVVVVKETGRLFAVLELVMKFSMDNNNSAAFNGIRQALSTKRAKGEKDTENSRFDYSTNIQKLAPANLGLKKITQDGISYIHTSLSYDGN